MLFLVTLSFPEKGPKSSKFWRKNWGQIYFSMSISYFKTAKLSPSRKLKFKIITRIINSIATLPYSPRILGLWK